jgi:sugar lactone lactonase YvrE
MLRHEPRGAALRPVGRLRRWSDRRGGLLGLVAAVLLLLVAPSASAAGDPTLDWWTIETAHARVHYERGLEPVAERVARVLEHIHGRLVEALGYEPGTITEIVLTDDQDVANGLATAVPFNTIRLYVTAPGDLTPLSDYDDWYLDLLTHEYTHILHTDDVSGVPAVINAVLGKTLVPNQAQPRWVIEGLAVLSETSYTTAGRLRSSLWDMFMRADVLEDKLASLDQMSSDPRRWPQGTIWYLYGSWFMSWIADVYGRDALRAMAVDYGASLVPWGVNRAIRRFTGKTYVELYQGFAAHLRERYQAQMREVERRGVREGRRLTFHGRHVAYPLFLPAAARRGSGDYEILYYRDDAHERSGLYRIDLSAAGGAAPAEQLVARSTAESPASVGRDGTLAYASVVPYQSVYSRTDLFALPPGASAPGGNEPERRRLTVGWRAQAPSLSPDGRHLAYTVNAAGTTRLELADIDPEGRLGRRRVLVRQERLEQAYTPVFSPDGRRVAYSTWLTGGLRDIWVVDVASGAVERVTHDRAFDANPCWSPDGQSLYFGSDRTGIFNIYQYTFADRTLRQVTNARIGAMMPAVSPDGRLLAYVGYTSAGFDLYLMPLDPTRFLEAPEPVLSEPASPPPSPPPTAMERHRYNPWPTLRPHRWFLSYAPGSFGSNALTVTVDGRDVVGDHSIAGAVIVDPAAEIPQLSLTYTYGRLPVDLSAQLFNRLSPRTDYRYNDQRPRYVERSYGIRTGLSYDWPGEFAAQQLGVSYSASLLDATLPVGSLGAPDPYASVTVNPFQGFVAVVHLGYAVTNVEGSFDAAGGIRSGVALNLGLDVADQATGSTESVYAASYRLRAYVPMPWPGKHTLALSTAGALSSGSYSRRGMYYVGGYDLSDTSALGLLDTITSGMLSGAFALRGYPPSSYAGSAYMLQNLEYRIPMANVDWGPETFPVYLRKLDGNLFLDWGGAFNKLDFGAIEPFAQGSLLYSPDLHTSVGAELWLGLTLGYQLDMQMRLGYAYGFSAEALAGGQAYFVASSAW